LGHLKKLFPPDEAARNPERFLDCLPGEVEADPRHDPRYDDRIDTIGMGHFGGGTPEVWDYISGDMVLDEGRYLILRIDVTEPWRGVLDRMIEVRVLFAQGIAGRRSRGIKGLPQLYAEIVLACRRLKTESPGEIAKALKGNESPRRATPLDEVVRSIRAKERAKDLAVLPRSIGSDPTSSEAAHDRKQYQADLRSLRTGDNDIISDVLARRIFGGG